jgi:predicted transposase YbfD/YdcC
VTGVIEPKQLGLAGAVQLARIDRQIGAKGKLNRTWEVTSRTQAEQNPQQWLAVDQQHWGIENRTHHTLDVTYREDESRGRDHNAMSALGILGACPTP